MECVYSNSRSTMNFKKGSKHRSRNVRKILQNIIVLVLVITSISVLFNVSLGKEELTTRTIIVSAGSTLWNIANEICENNSSLNVQNVIIQIKDLNNLKSSIIYEGQELLVYEY